MVIDLYAVDGDSKVNEQYLHNFTDAMPFSMLKVKMVQDLLEPGKRMEYLFNLSLYHSRWEELTRIRSRLKQRTANTLLNFIILELEVNKA